MDMTTIGSFVLGAVSSLAATGLIWLAKELMYKFGDSHSGTWTTYIFEDNNDVPVKVDRLKIKHNRKTGLFSGKIKRVEPIGQNYRKWKCMGVFIKNAMLIVFWPNEATFSYGVEYLIHTADFRYDGYYLKYENGSSDIIRVKLVNKKDRKHATCSTNWSSISTSDKSDKLEEIN